MSSDPFFSGGPPTTLLGALSAAIAVLFAVVRTLWKDNKEKDETIADLQNARVEDQKAHTQEVLKTLDATHKTSGAIHAAIDALKKKRTSLEND